MAFDLFAYPMYFIMVVSAVISLILALVTKVLIDQDRMKDIQKEVKVYNQKLMKATREKDQKVLDKLGKEKSKIMGLQNEMMKMQMPMFASMLPFFVVFYFLRQFATAQGWGEFIMLPFMINVLNIGNSFTWLGWYILCSMPFTVLFRKFLGVR